MCAPCARPSELLDNLDDKALFLAELFGAEPACKQAAEYVHLQGIEDVDKVQAYPMGVEGMNKIEEKGEQGEIALLSSLSVMGKVLWASMGSSAGELPSTDGRLCRGVRCCKCDKVGLYQDQCPSRKTGAEADIILFVKAPGIHGF